MSCSHQHLLGGGLVGLRGCVVAGGDAAALLQAVETPLNYVAPLPVCDGEGVRADDGIADEVDLAGQAPRERPRAGRQSPLFGPWRSDGVRGRRWSRPTRASRSPGLVRSGLCRLEHPLESAVQGSAAETEVQRGPPPVPLGHIPPGRARPELPHNPVDHRALVQPLPAPQGLGRQRPDELSLAIGQCMATYHPTMIHHARSFVDIAQETSSCTRIEKAKG